MSSLTLGLLSYLLGILFGGTFFAVVFAYGMVRTYGKEQTKEILNKMVEEDDKDE